MSLKSFTVFIAVCLSSCQLWAGENDSRSCESFIASESRDELTTRHPDYGVRQFFNNIYEKKRKAIIEYEKRSAHRDESLLMLKREIVFFQQTDFLGDTRRYETFMASYIQPQLICLSQLLMMNGNIFTHGWDIHLIHTGDRARVHHAMLNRAWLKWNPSSNRYTLENKAHRRILKDLGKTALYRVLQTTENDLYLAIKLWLHGEQSKELQIQLLKVIREIAWEWEGVDRLDLQEIEKQIRNRFLEITPQEVYDFSAILIDQIGRTWGGGLFFSTAYEDASNWSIFMQEQKQLSQVPLIIKVELNLSDLPSQFDESIYAGPFYSTGFEVAFLSPESKLWLLQQIPYKSLKLIRFPEK